jgi:hypothetical protein
MQRSGFSVFLNNTSKRSGLKVWAVAGALIGLTACSTLPEPTGQLSGYSNLDKSKGVVARYKTFANHDGLAEYKRIHIRPVVITASAAAKAGDANLNLVSNAIARDMCNALAGYYQIVDQAGADSLELAAFVTDFSPTSAKASAASSAIGFFSPVSRLPIGLGLLSAEAEVLSPDGQQLASLVWSRKANLLDTGGLSQISDAYAFSGGFSSAFVKVLKPVKSPVKSNLSAAPKPGSKAFEQQKAVNGAACKVYGEGPGVKGFLNRFSPLGAPPEWIDKGRATKPQPDQEPAKAKAAPK